MRHDSACSMLKGLSTSLAYTVDAREIISQPTDRDASQFGRRYSNAAETLRHKA